EVEPRGLVIGAATRALSKRRAGERNGAQQQCNRKPAHRHPRQSLCMDARLARAGPSSIIHSTNRRAADLDASSEVLAGAAGFEPANAGTKNRCLTTWRRPSRRAACAGEGALIAASPRNGRGCGGQLRLRERLDRFLCTLMLAQTQR